MSIESANSLTVLVTGVGAIIGQGIIKSLRMSEQPLKIIGVDLNAEAFGRRHCDSFFPKPTGAEDEYLSDFFCQLIGDHNVDLVIPGIEQDLYYFDQFRGVFDELPVKLVLNNSEIIALGRDKWTTFERLQAGGHLAIPTSICSEWAECVAQLGPPPLLLKPRKGSGSVGIQLLHNESDFCYWRDKLADNFMVQKVVGRADAEYTVAVFGYGDGRATAPAIFRRTLGPDGATWQAETVASLPLVEAFVIALNLDWRPIGPTNYQFRIDDGQAYLLEVNPRISASTSLRAILGVNEALMCVEYFCFARELAEVKLKRGRAFRYVEDLVEIQ